MVPGSCCKTDPEKYPVITPHDAHCIYVPTNYNSHWNKVRDAIIKNFKEARNVINLMLSLNYWQ